MFFYNFYNFFSSLFAHISHCNTLSFVKFLFRVDYSLCRRGSNQDLRETSPDRQSTLGRKQRFVHDFLSYFIFVNFHHPQ